MLLRDRLADVLADPSGLMIVSSLAAVSSTAFGVLIPDQASPHVGAVLALPVAIPTSWDG
jgi:hypothetical protein